MEITHAEWLKDYREMQKQIAAAVEAFEKKHAGRVQGIEIQRIERGEMFTYTETKAKIRIEF
jgi:hypothetical protein